MLLTDAVPALEKLPAATSVPLKSNSAITSPLIPCALSRLHIDPSPAPNSPRRPPSAALTTRPPPSPLLPPAAGRSHPPPPRGALWRRLPPPRGPPPPRTPSGGHIAAW